MILSVISLLTFLKHKFDLSSHSNVSLNNSRVCSPTSSSTHHIYTSRHISTTKELKCCKTQTHVLCCVLCFQRTACRFSSPHWCYSRCQQRCRRSSQSCSESSPESGRDRTQHAESEPTSSRSQRQKQQVDWLMKFTYLLLTNPQWQNHYSSVDNRALLWPNTVTAAAAAAIW